ncbi:hypothetical protein [Kocuria sp.]|uniref:hypothetical protein n=1 Tax=Kocuria sp. TaxID=1871328 RepID=UPI0026DFDAD5|nr:hypothetical protein [Kocuria sp.]MDO5619515.1 hypothetical protein [Kocuria sp.]
MPRAYGFRVFIVEAYSNRKKDQTPLDCSSSSSVRNETLELIERLHAKGTMRFPPRAPKDGEPDKPTQTATMSAPVVVNQEVIHLEIATGETGSHGFATHPVEPAMNIADRSAERPYLITLVFSPQTANRFVIVAQTAHRRDGLRRFLSMLTQEGIVWKNERRVAQEVLREAAKTARHPLPTRRPESRLLFDANQASDNAFLDEILQGAKSASATFTSRLGSNRGGEPDRVGRTLKISLVDDKQREIAPQVGRTWMGRKRRGDATSTKEGVSEVSALLESENLLDEHEGDRYDEVSLSIRSASNETTTIAVDTLRDVFTYPVSDGSPGIKFYYEQVAARLHTIAMQDGLHLNPIDPDEVEECLRVLIPDR